MEIWNKIRSLGKRENPQAESSGNIEALLKTMFRNSIVMNIEGSVSGQTRFGGVPDVPADFVWPAYEYEGEETPLAFLAQIDCADLAAHDAENLLPETGLLSFFYDYENQPWGFEEGDADGARVYWFEETTNLTKVAAPEGIKPFPVLGIALKAEKSLPDWDDFAVFCPEEDDCDLFEEERAMLGAEIPEECSKLLGWPDAIQNSVFEECAAKDGSSLGDWILLFQLDTVTDGEFELMFGDCGRIYLCMKKADLAARRFDRIHLTLQCY